MAKIMVELLRGDHIVCHPDGNETHYKKGDTFEIEESSFEILKFKMRKVEGHYSPSPPSENDEILEFESTLAFVPENEEDALDGIDTFVPSINLDVMKLNHKIIELLRGGGLETVHDVFNKSTRELCEIDGIGKRTATKILDEAKRVLLPAE